MNPRQITVALVIVCLLCAYMSARHGRRVLATEELELHQATIVDVEDTHALERQLVETVREEDTVYTVRAQPDTTAESCEPEHGGLLVAPTQGQRCTCAGPVVTYTASDGGVVSRHCPRRAGPCPAGAPSHIRLRADRVVACDYGGVPLRRCQVNGVSCDYVAERCPEVGEEVYMARERATGKVSCAADNDWNKCHVKLRVRRFAEVLEHTSRVRMQGECAERFTKGSEVQVHYSRRRGTVRLVDGPDPWDDGVQMALCLIYGACGIAALGGMLTVNLAFSPSH